MKRVKCPKCDNHIVFDETKYQPGQTLVFVCQHCKKEFKVCMGKTALGAIHQEKSLDEQAYADAYGSVVVVENVFAFKQVIPLDFGVNEFGRYVKGTHINKPIVTKDPSIDTFHCTITVKKDKCGRLVYVLSDAPSDTGTFYMNEILKDTDKIVMDNDAIVTIGATTLILRKANEK